MQIFFEPLKIAGLDSSPRFTSEVDLSSDIIV
jgi:hypothetical protein